MEKKKGSGYQNSTDVGVLVQQKAERDEKDTPCNAISETAFRRATVVHAGSVPRRCKNCSDRDREVYCCPTATFPG